MSLQASYKYFLGHPDGRYNLFCGGRQKRISATMPVQTGSSGQTLCFNLNNISKLNNRPIAGLKKAASITKLLFY